MSKTAKEVIERATIDCAGVKALLGPGNSVEADLNAAGFEIVPKEPTHEMLLAAKEAVKDRSEWGIEWLEAEGEGWTKAYSAMIAEAKSR